MPENKHHFLSGKTILIVEDDFISTEFLVKVLEFKDLNLLFATNGEEAIRLVKNHPEIDLVLMDIRLPGVNGYDATREINAINKNLPVIAQTAYALEGDNLKALEAGCVAHISKPIDTEELFRLIQKHIS
ncbi:MAG: response regulator [Bacteroidales bacterium]|nr:response regulator [Bacteroidales bacterium]